MTCLPCSDTLTTGLPQPYSASWTQVIKTLKMVCVFLAKGGNGGRKLLDHIISRLEPQLLDYVEVRHRKTSSSLLQLIDKYEERFLNRMTRGPSHDFRNENHSANNQFTNRNRHENWRDTRVENRYHDTSRPLMESKRFGGQDVGDNRRFDSRRRSGQSDNFNNHGGRQGGSRNGAFRGLNGQDRNLNF
ncbi:uncharacterized protein TNCV_4741 [Trichonephila clavipes]|nr:uncharacterized protein TNCV_4741 [Trichonephila clavipes]